MTDRTPLQSPPTALSRRHLVWLFGLALAIALLVWWTLYEVKDVALHNTPDSAVHAACIAGFDATSGQSVDQACPPHAKVIFAARHPVRNAIIIFILLLGGGYAYLRFHFSSRGPSFGHRVPPASP